MSRAPRICITIPMSRTSRIYVGSGESIRNKTTAIIIIFNYGSNEDNLLYGSSIKEMQIKPFSVVVPTLNKVFSCEFDCLITPFLTQSTIIMTELINTSGCVAVFPISYFQWLSVGHKNCSLESKMFHEYNTSKHIGTLLHPIHPHVQNYS